MTPNLHSQSHYKILSLLVALKAKVVGQNVQKQITEAEDMCCTYQVGSETFALVGQLCSVWVYYDSKTSGRISLRLNLWSVSDPKFTCIQGISSKGPT